MKLNFRSILFSIILFMPFITQCSSSNVAPTAVATIGPEVSATKDAHTVSLVTLEWAPYVGEKLDGNGFTAEIVRTALERAGFKVTVTFMPWARGLQETESGKYDLIFPAYYSDERAQKYLFSDAFANSPIGFYKLKDKAISYTKLEDLKPYRIGVVRGFVNTAEFDAANYLQKDVVDSDEQNLQKLLLGRIDLAVIDKYVAQAAIATSIPEGKDKLEFVEPALDLKPLYVMASRNIPDGKEIIDGFNTSLKQMTADGTIEKIMAQFGFHK